MENDKSENEKLGKPRACEHIRDDLKECVLESDCVKKVNIANTKNYNCLLIAFLCL